MPNSSKPRVAFQGEPGAYSHLACREFLPELDPLACATFEEAIAAVDDGRAELALLPVENSFAGRVADAHVMLPEAGLHIVGEHFLRIEHHLLARPGITIDALRCARSHAQALDQCRTALREMGLAPDVHGDTAGAARSVAEGADETVAAIASSLAGEIHGLVSLRTGFADDPDNTTRFVALAREPRWPAMDSGPVITTIVFEVRNVPAALYKALGGFATNAVNLTKIESYQRVGSFRATAFYADLEGHPDDDRVRLAMEELAFFTTRVVVLGVYPADRHRNEKV